MSLRNRYYCNRWNGIHSTNRIYYTIITPGLVCIIDGASSLTLIKSFDSIRTYKVQAVSSTATREAGLTSISAAGPGQESWRRECGGGEEICEDEILFHG